MVYYKLYQFDYIQLTTKKGNYKDQSIFWEEGFKVAQKAIWLLQHHVPLKRLGEMIMHQAVINGDGTLNTHKDTHPGQLIGTGSTHAREVPSLIRKIADDDHNIILSLSPITRQSLVNAGTALCSSSSGKFAASFENAKRRKKKLQCVGG